MLVMFLFFFSNVSLLLSLSPRLCIPPLQQHPNRTRVKKKAHRYASGSAVLAGVVVRKGMSDALAILDGAAAAVSSLMMPDGPDKLVAFLRGDAWEGVPSMTAASSSSSRAGDGDPNSAPQLLPNMLVNCYNYIPLAIAADVSLVPVSFTSSSSSGERSTLVQNFERHEFHVFSVNLMPETHTSDDDSLRLNERFSNSNRSAHAVRLNCMHAVRVWCDALYAEEKENESRRRDSITAAKRNRYEKHRQLGASAAVKNVTHGIMGARLRRALFIISCCGSGGGGAVGAGSTDRSRHPRDTLLLLLLHDISAMAALCHARRSTHRTHIRFAVLLLPDDLVYGGALLEEALRRPVYRDYCVRLFRGAASNTAQQHNDGGEIDSFLRRLELWMVTPPILPVNENGGSTGGDEGEQLQRREAVIGEAMRRRESNLFFVRRDNLSLCCFLREALRRFPVILHPIALRQLQSLWASRHQLSDVVLGFHTLLCPFALLSSKQQHYRSGSLESVAVAAAGSVPDSICRLSDSIDLLNALLVAAGQWADGHPLNEAVAFAVLYEDLVWKQPSRLQRVPGVVDVLQRLWHRQHNEGDGGRSSEVITQEALTSCVPVFMPSSVLQDKSYHFLPHERAEGGAREVVVLPAAMAASAANSSLTSELLHAALTAVLPPQESLEELQGAVKRFRSSSGDGERDRDSSDPAQSCCLAANNFFSPAIPDSTRVLHVLCAQALARVSTRNRYVPLAVLQRVCQISDETLVRTLTELQLVGMVTVNAQEFKAKSLLCG